MYVLIRNIFCKCLVSVCVTKHKSCSFLWYYFPNINQPFMSSAYFSANFRQFRFQHFLWHPLNQISMPIWLFYSHLRLIQENFSLLFCDVENEDDENKRKCKICFSNYVSLSFLIIFISTNSEIYLKMEYINDERMNLNTFWSVQLP